MASYGYTFQSGDGVTPTRLNAARTVSDIVDADIKSDAAIAGSKLADNSVTSAKIADGTIVNADVAANAAIAGTKIAPNFGSQDVVTTGRGTFAVVETSGALPNIQITDTDASANNQRWDILANGQSMLVRAVNDAYSAATSAIEIQRTGITVDSVSMPNGNVGIGTSSPQRPLEIVKNNGASIGIVDTSTGGNALVLEPARNSNGFAQIDVSGANALRINTNASERMRIDATGNVGIGTMSPAAKLDVNGDMRAAYLAVSNPSGDTAIEVGGTGSVYIDLKKPSSDDYDLRISTDSTISALDTASNQDLALQTGTGRNVGIGTASPSTKLEVNGTVTATTFAGPLTGNVTGNLTGTASAIADGSVSTAKIVDGAVTNAKIASGVDASKLTTGTLPADRIGSSTITTARINDGAVTAAKLDGAQTGSAPIYGCRAWVFFDGTKDTTGAASTANTNRQILASGNVSSVTRTAPGTYTVNFTTAMPDANFAAFATSTAVSSAARNFACGVGNRTTSSVSAHCETSDGAAIDQSEFSVCMFR